MTAMRTADDTFRQKKGVFLGFERGKGVLII